MENLRQLKEELWKRRLSIISQIKTPDWTTENLDKVLKSLKKNKSRDEKGWINEIFRPEIIGSDLKQSILRLVNGIKAEMQVPEFLRSALITTIYKNKGERSDLINDRGVFRLNCIRTVLDKLIYCDKYDEIDRNMSESNIGGRKSRNIRNHLFILYGILNSVKQKESKPVDIQLYDIKQMFDSMWEAETMNDLYEVCTPDDKIALVYEGNKEIRIKVNTPFGETGETNVKDCELQGSVLSPIKASISVDSIGKQASELNENMYIYKKLLNVPPLAMVDDILGIAECGQKSIALNVFINSKVEMKKLWMGAEKCHHIHVGNRENICPDLIVHNDKMKRVAFDKYVGDVISEDCLNKENIEAKYAKGMGMITQIMLILEELCLGNFYFETAILLRESMFVNSVLCSIEVSYGLTKENIKTLEYSERIFLMYLIHF